jgi:hypothetical protein
MRLTGGRRFAVVASVLGVVASIACVPMPAAAATFGADLNNTPNNPTTCGEGIFPYLSAPMGSPSCMYYSGAPGPSSYAPASGTITAVHVRVGAVTGPMQAVIMRSLYQNKAGDPGHPYFACCFVERYGPVFTPQANTVTTVATSLPVTEEATPGPDDFSTTAAGDFLALSVLAPNVPIPAFGDGRSGYAGYYPAPSEGSTPAPSPNPLTAATDGFGAQVLISADLDTGGGGGGGAAPAPGGPAPTPNPAPVPAPLASIAFPKLTIPVKNGTATLPLQCLVVNCAGVLNLQNVQPPGGAGVASKKKAKKPKLVSYGAASFALKAGTTGKVKVKLNAAGRKLVKAHKQIKVWASVRFTAGGGRAKSTRVTLKR